MEREEEQVQSEQSTPQVENSTPPAANQNPIPESPSTDISGKALYLQVLQDKNRELDRLQRELEAKNRQQEAPKQFTQEQEQQFFTNPLSQTRDLIREEVQQAISPLLGFVQGFQKNDAYTQLKATARNNPLYGRLLTELEPYIDQAMKGMEPTEANLMAATFQIQGLRSAGVLDQIAGQNNQQSITAPVQNPPVTSQRTNPQTNMNIPPHLRPTPPAAPRDTQEPYKKPLTENERTLIREQGWTEEEYRSGQKEGPTIIEPETNVGPRKRTPPVNKENANV